MSLSPSIFTICVTAQYGLSGQRRGDQLKPKVRLLIAVVCWIGGFLSLITGMGMGMMSQWAGIGGQAFLALGGALIVVAILLSIPRKNTGK